jgi:hypothetical protein
MDDVVWPAPSEHPVERLRDEAGLQVAGRRPAEDAPAEGVEHHREIENPCPGRHGTTSR